MTSILLQANAFSGASEDSFSDAHPSNWIIRQHLEAPHRTAAPPAEADLRQWQHPDVGWGVVLPMADLPPRDLAVGADAPEPIQRLLAHRSPAPVLRYEPGLPRGVLRRHHRDGTHRDLFLSTPKRGVEPGRLPRYLLFVGSPAEIPWSVQYDWNAAAYVGRLDLTLEGLGRYVDALIGDWSASGRRTGWNRAVVWAPVHDGSDITALMHEVIAKPVHAAFRGDGEFDDTLAFLDGTATRPTGDDLIDALATVRPGIVVTTSHGRTGPLANPAALAAKLGLPVDAERQPLDLAGLVEAWSPAGAIWYAHACCCAGGGGGSLYGGLFPASSSLGKLIDGIGSLRPVQAPLPKALLGSRFPLRAFIGHVEPTFDWSLRHPRMQVRLTGSLVRALYQGLCGQKPVGMAMNECFQDLAWLSGLHADAMRRVGSGDALADEDLAVCLMDRDWRSMVLLGDPTVSLPKAAEGWNG